LTWQVHPKKTPFTFDGHDTAFSCWKDGGHDCRKPDPVGAAEALLDVFSDKWGKILYYSAFRRLSRHPQPMAQFSKSRRASANRRPRTTACGLRPWPPKCLVARLGLWKLCPGPGVSAVIRIYKELDLIKKCWPSMEPATMSYCSEEKIKCLIVRF